MAGVADHLTVEIAFGNKAHDASPTWTDVTTYLRAFDLPTSSRSADADAFSAGVGSITLAHETLAGVADREMDPYYSSSTYAGDFLAGTPVRVRSSTATIWRGYVEEWAPAGDEYDGVTVVRCVDGLGLLADAEILNETVLAYQRVSITDRLGIVLDEAGWPSGDRDIGGTSSVVEAGAVFGQNALAELVNAARSDGGFVYYEPSTHEIVFETRHGVAERSRMKTSQETFGGTGLEYLSGSLRHAAAGRGYRNLAEVTLADGTTVTAGTLAAGEPTRRLARSTTLVSPNVAQALADFSIDAATEDPYPQGWRTRVAIGSTGMNLDVRDLRLRDRITVEWDPFGPGSTESHDVFVDSIRHTLTAGVWDVELECSPAAGYDSIGATGWLVIGTGLIGTGTIGY